MKFWLLSLCLLVVSYHSIAQSGVYQFDDSTEVYVQVVSSNPEKGRNKSIYLGAFGPDAMPNIIGFSYFKPKKSYLNIMGGLHGGTVDGNIILTTKHKPVTMKQSVKMAYGGYNRTTKYVVEVPSQKQFSTAVHLGGSYYQYTLYDPFSAIGLIGGMSLIKSRYAHWLIDSEYQEGQGTSINRLNADVVFYVNRQALGAEPTTINIAEDTRQIGWRLYYDGKATLWSRKGHLGFQYMLGIGQGVEKKSMILLAGLGLGYSF
ncbi:MAG: hypothetical protein AAF992_06565 [Bacteroidota bacterium]